MSGVMTELTTQERLSATPTSTAEGNPPEALIIGAKGGEKSLNPSQMQGSSKESGQPTLIPSITFATTPPIETATATLTNNDGNVSLVEAAKITSVPYDTLIYATKNGKLAVERNPAIHNDSLHVHIFELCKFMVSDAPKKYRWFEKHIRLEEIVPDSKNQPRQKENTKLITKIVKKLRLGGRTRAIWVIKDGKGSYVVVDGHHRLEAYEQSCRDTIPVVVLDIPLCFAIAISRAANLEHGQNLTPTDQQKIIGDHFRGKPSDFDALQAGALSQAELARRLNVHPVSIGRFLDRIGKKTKTPLPEIEILRDVQPLFAHLNHDDPCDAKCIAFVLSKVTPAIVNSWDKATQTHIRDMLVIGSSPIARLLTPRIRALLDQRGGDRGKHHLQYSKGE